MSTLFFLIVIIGCALFSVSIIQSILGGVPFVPLEKSVADKMLQILNLRQGTILYDLGCGDARHLIAACLKYPIIGVGIEISWGPFILAWLKRKIYHLESRISLKWGNIKNYNLSEADVIFAYLDRGLLNNLKDKFAKELKPGCQIVSARFPISDWVPKEIIKSEKYSIFLYVI